ncbi:MAG TPA: hypothetical protein VK421_09690 [Pyrinomonadaceae bacterium]|nr:hypothetical protein [Pyrinomonadaceae bacterium]
MPTTDPTHAAPTTLRAARKLARLLLAVTFVAASSFPTAAQGERPRESRPAAVPAGEVVVVLNEQLFNALVESVFMLPQPPTFPLREGEGSAEKRPGECASEIQLAREVAGTRTAVHFRDGRFSAPVAFRGSYGAPLVGCLSFEGWADTQLNLTFDQQRQALTARAEVRRVSLRNVPALLSDGVTTLVQSALDQRVNPIEILRAEQVSALLPLKRFQTGGSLRLRAREVRHEILPGELRLRIVYEFVREN